MATMNPFMMEQRGFICRKVRAPNSLPSSLYANKPTESTAAEPLQLWEASRQGRGGLSLVCLVGEPFRLPANTEGLRDHDGCLLPSVSLLRRQCWAVRPRCEVKTRARRPHCFSGQRDDHEGRRAS